MKGRNVGEFEELVLMSVLRLGDEANSVDILEVLESVAERRSSLGAIYAALDRLQRKGMVTSWIAEPEAGTPGRPRRHFKATDQGIATLDHLEAVRLRMRQGIRDGLQETR